MKFLVFFFLFFTNKRLLLRRIIRKFTNTERELEVSKKERGSMVEPVG